MKQLDSKVVALSGISAALAVIFILGAVYIPNITLTCYMFAALSISLPLIKNYIFGAIFSYIVSSVLAFLLASIQVLPFIIFFGLYAIILWLLDFKLFNVEKIKVWVKILIIILIKLSYFFAAFFACFKLMGLVITDFTIFNINWTMPLLLVTAFIVFSIYDIIYREVFKVVSRILLRRIK